MYLYYFYIVNIELRFYDDWNKHSNVHSIDFAGRAFQLKVQIQLTIYIYIWNISTQITNSLDSYVVELDFYIHAVQAYSLFSIYKTKPAVRMFCLFFFFHTFSCISFVNRICKSHLGKFIFCLFSPQNYNKSLPILYILAIKLNMDSKCVDFSSIHKYGFFSGHFL